VMVGSSALARMHLKKLFVVLAVCLLSGCTLRYKASSPWEDSVLRKSVFNVYPLDVVREPTKFNGTLVAWAGIIETATFHESSGTPMVEFRIQHHFFDWAMDGTTRKYWLSPKGEGVICATWPLKPEWSIVQLRQLIQPGDMVVVYGYPKSIREDGAIDFGQAEYVRHIPKDWFRTDVLEYGRPGDPVRSLSLGL